MTQPPQYGLLNSIQIRVKEPVAKTYEEIKNIEFDIVDGTDKKTAVTSITLDYGAPLARTPITITGNAQPMTENSLYKFIISNGFIYYVETAYSTEPTYVWVPGKSGNYNISVLVKSQVSFVEKSAVSQNKQMAYCAFKKFRV